MELYIYTVCKYVLEFISGARKILNNDPNFESFGCEFWEKVNLSCGVNNPFLTNHQVIFNQLGVTA